MKKQAKHINMKKNFVWNLIGLTFYCFTSLAFMIIVKQINGLNQSGIFSYAYSICTLFFYISLYYNRSYQISNYGNNKKFNNYLTNRILTSIITIFLMIIFCLINRFDSFKTIIILLLLVYRAIEAVIDTFYGYLQANDKLYQVGISYTFKSLFGTIIFLIVNKMTGNLILAIISLGLMSILTFIFYDWKCFSSLKKEKIELDFSKSFVIFKEALPIFIFSFASIYLSNAQKFILNYYASNEMQSIFAMLVMPATVLSLVGSYLINPFLNSLNENYKKNNIKKFNNTVKKILICLFLVGVLAFVTCFYIGIPVLNIIYRINLNKYKIDLLLIIVGSIFMASTMIISNCLTIIESNRGQAMIYITSSILASILIPIFINYGEIKAGSLSYLFSNLFNLVAFLILYVIIIIKKRKIYKRWLI